VQNLDRRTLVRSFRISLGVPLLVCYLDKIILAPAIEGVFVVTTRGGDFELHLGQDLSHRLSFSHRHFGSPLPTGNLYVLTADRGSVGGTPKVILRKKTKIDSRLP